MKTINYLLSLIVILSVWAIQGCSSDDDSDLTLEQPQLLALSGTWSVSGDADVKLSGNDAPGNWSGFSINFTELKVVSVNNVPSETTIFQVSSFDVGGTNTETINLTFNDDENETAVANINGDTMTLSFQLDTQEDKLGRVNSVTGTWTFELTR